MKTKGDARRIWTIVCLFVLFSAFTAGGAAAATYHSSPAGSGTTCSSGSPCSLATGLGKLAAGDTLFLNDGTYNSGITVGVSGANGNPVTIKALNDGRAIIDGQGSRGPLVISGKSFINVEGIVFVNSNADVIRVSGGSSYINLRRISAYNAGVGNYHLFLIWNSHHVLVEDCVASQGAGSNKAGRYCFLSHAGAHDNTFRRNYCKYYSHTGGGGPCAAGADYGGSYDRWENNVFDVSEMPAGCSDVGYQFAIFGEGLYNDTSHNQWYGNVSIGGPNTIKAVLGEADVSISLANWELVNNVFINARDGIVNIGASKGAGWIVQNNTVVNIQTNSMTQTLGSGATAAVTNNSYLTGSTGLSAVSGSSITSKYNNFSTVSTLYDSNILSKTGDKTLKPAYDTATFGNGAYLMIPSALQKQGEGGVDVGAEVLHQYQNGTLTNTPLWPWPMEGRIVKELGMSVTWSADGGVWKTLDGVYTVTPPPPPPPVTDTTPPSTPVGIASAVISSTQINLSWTASTDNVGVAGYNVYKNGAQVATPAGTHHADTGLSPSTTYTYTVSAYDAAGNVSPQSGLVSATTSEIIQAESPYPGPGPASVPGIIEAENFDNGGEGVAYHDTDPANDGGAYRQTGVDMESCSEGGYNVGWIYPGEWMNYTINVAAAGTYDIEARVAADAVSGGTFHIEFNGVNKTGIMTVSPTGAWQTWTTIKKSGVSLPAGTQVMRFVFDTQSGYGMNLNYIKISASSPPPTGDTTPPSTPGGLVARTPSSTQINLGWTASTDNVGVAGYRIYRNGKRIATTASAKYADKGLSTATVYTYTVSAYDAAGNASPQSGPVSAKTRQY